MRGKTRQSVAGRAGQRLGVLGRKITIVIISAMLVLWMAILPVRAEGNDYSPSYEKPEEFYMLLPIEDDSAYEVVKGDSLWKIAEKLWGDGSLYPVLYELNKETVKEPNLIYPGEKLVTTRPIYMKNFGFTGITSENQFRFDAPSGCTFGYLAEGEAGASFAAFGSSYDIACIVQEKTAAQDALKDYRTWEREIRAYAEEEYGDAVQCLEFEEYLAQDGGIVYLYSYIDSIDLARYDSEGSIDVLVAVGVRQTEHMQAEFVGFSLAQEDLTDRVRYVTASFEELMPEGAVCNVNEHNMRMSPEAEWEAASFNAMAWIDSYFDVFIKRVSGYDENHKSRKEKVLDQMREGKGT